MSQTRSENSPSDKGYQIVQIGPEKLEIPEEWTVTTVNDVASRFISGGTPDSDNENFWGGEIPWTTSAVVKGPYFEGQKDFITQEGLDNSSATLVPEGSILFGTRVSVANVGRTKKEIAISQDLTGIVLDEERIDPDFATWYLLYNQSKISDRYGQGSTIQGIITADLKSLQLLSPPLAEQRRIADILSTVDEQIQNVDETIQKTYQLRDGIIQDFFNSGLDNSEVKELRVGAKKKYVPNHWDVRRLEEVSTVKRGASPRPISDERYFGGDVGWVRISDITRSDKYLKQTSDYLSEEGVSESVLVQNNTVLLSISATIGKPAILQTDACIHDGIVAFRDLSEEVDPEYLYYALLEMKERLKSQNQRAAGHQTNVNSTVVKRSKILLPPIEEQQTIKNVLGKVDEKILREKKEKESLKQLRRGLMQDLLTGKIRVNTD
jgi:type I restriction enzyme S subunit